MNYNNDNRGVLFVNDKKQKETHPDWKGTINIGGKAFRISAWKKKTKKGDVISIQVSDGVATARPAPQNNFVPPSPPENSVPTSTGMPF